MDLLSHEMERSIATYPWSDSCIGPQSEWPQALKLIVDISLKSPFPMLIWWGPEMVQIYNDAYVSLFGARHPNALGQRAQECWPEIWEQIASMISGVMTSGHPVKGEDARFVLERNGYPEEAYFTFSYSLIDGPEGHRGVLCTNMETTASVTRENQFHEMTDNLANVIYTHSPDGTITWANRRWFDYTKLPTDIALTKAGWQQVLAPEDFTLILGILQTAFETGKPYEAEIRIKPFESSDASYRWYLLRALPMRRLDGTIDRWVGSATDVHDQRIAQDSLRASLEHDLDQERHASLAFQTAALPQLLPLVPGMEFDAIYEAAGGETRVGGDWFDAFRLPDGRVVLSVGDVIGSGLEAAVTMSAARQAIRGAAQVYPNPAAVLDAADRALRSEQPDRIVTAFLGIFDPVTYGLAYASAGHPPPFLRHADGQVDELADSNLPLGLRDQQRAQPIFVTIPENALLVMYTDGLTEATHNVLEGEEYVRAALAREEIAFANEPAQALRDALPVKGQDDVAILTARIGKASNKIYHWAFGVEDALAAAACRRDMVTKLKEKVKDKGRILDAELILGELIGNVARHADGQIEVALDLANPSPVLHVLDRGLGFTYFARLPKDHFSETGRGLFIIAQLAQDVSIVPRPGGGSHARAVLAMYSDLYS